MSDYIEKKVIRIPLYKEEDNFPVFLIDEFKERVDETSDREIHELMNIVYEEFNEGSFQLMTHVSYGNVYQYEVYLELVLEEEYGSDSGEYSRRIDLLMEDSEKIILPFKEKFPSVTTKDLERWDYCYYNGSEPDILTNPPEDNTSYLIDDYLRNNYYV